MSRRYIELYSANRNRNQFPLCSSFEVPFAPTRQLLLKSHSNDPICTGPIYYKWIGGSPAFNSPWPNPSTITADSNSTPGCIFLTAATPYLSNILNLLTNFKELFI